MKALAVLAAIAAATFIAAPSWHDATTPTPPAAGSQVAPQEDEPGWNCMTQGNRVCGPAFVPMSPALVDAFAVEDANLGAHPWKDCLISEGDTSVVVCPDGYTTTS